MNQKIIHHLLLWSGIIILLLSVWNTWSWITLLVGGVLIFISAFFTRKAIERRYERKLEKWKEKHKEKHDKINETEIDTEMEKKIE